MKSKRPIHSDSAVAWLRSIFHAPYEAQARTLTWSLNNSSNSTILGIAGLWILRRSLV
jgi:hypothetical protein